MLLILSIDIPHLGPHTIKVRLKTSPCLLGHPLKHICAVSFWWEQWLLWEFIWQFIQSLCAHIKLQGDSEQLNCFNFVCLCLWVCSGAQALILDACMLVPAGFITGADDCVPLYSLLFIYYFIYNLSTANIFTPMGALWIHLDIIKKWGELCKGQLHKFDHTMMIRWGWSKQMTMGSWTVAH